ncbi:MAG TPA: glycosyltransferase family 39 protein [Acidimicrobiales bacterium]|jgi:O-antigen/teichoic acid export membrane protein|nr:glycosyltransferase family 39 protein [Acidimicrobiales bacterium]
MTALVERPRGRAPSTAAVRDQAVVASGQIAAGLGNMVFSLVMARILAPGTFAQFASFLALYLLLSMPGSAVSAVAALEPAKAARFRPALLLGGAGVGIALAVASPWVGPALRLPVAMVVVLGLSAPALGTLALDRGRLYGWNRHARLVASLVVEPAVRLLLGLALATAGGAVGGALGVTVAGYAALEIARRHPRGRPATTVDGPETEVEPAPKSAPPALPRAATWTVLAFLAVVVVQNQDLLIANRVLTPGQAGQFAVLSTLGGLSVFATMTVPLVLLPRSRAGEGGLLPALGITALIGGAAVGVVALAPAALVTALFGSQYRQVAGVLVLYMTAMSLLGIARVLVAHRCATGAGRSSLVLAAMAVAAQAGLIVSFGHDTRSVALSTTAAVSGLTVSLGVAEALRWERLRQRWASLHATLVRPVTLAVLGFSLTGLVVRLIVPRGLWLDEATSVDQARMSFAGMISNLRTTDVHPPLYFSVLWVSVRWLGSGELAVRLPSIIAGSLVVPMLYVLGKEAYDRRTGVVAAAVGSVAPIMVWYSQEARMYALLMLFGVIALWAQVRILNRGGRLVWVVYAVASIALVWTQYFGALQVVVQQLAFLYFIWARRRRGEPVRGLVIGWAVTLATIIIWLAPLLPFAYQQFHVNQTAGKGFGGPQQVGNATSLSGNHLSIYAGIANLLWAVWGYHSNAAMALMAAMWPLGMLFALVLLGRRHQRVTTLLVAAVIIPGVVMFALGTVKRNLFDIRYLSTAVPVLFVLIARMVTGISRKTVTVVAGTSLVIATMLVGLIDQQYNGTNPRTYDFRQAIEPVEAQARPGDIISYDPVDLREVVQYYAPKPVLEPVAALTTQSTAGHAVYVVASRSLMNGPSDAAALNKALTSLRAHDRLVMHRQLANVEIWEFK